MNHQQFDVTSSWRMILEVLQPPKTNIDTQKDDLVNVSPFKHGYFWYPVSMLIFSGEKLRHLGVFHRSLHC